MNTVQVLSSLGLLYLSKNQIGKAEPYLAEALERLDRTLGDHHAYAYFIRLNAAEMYWGLSRLEEAESMARETLKRTRPGTPEYEQRKSLLENF